jgi:uncharacterized protein YbjT (DUF2867 family)
MATSQAEGAQAGQLTVVAVGATGSIGRHVVAESLRRGYRTRALVRAVEAAGLPDNAEVVVGDLTRAETLGDAVEGVDCVVFTHGSHGGAAEAEQVDYGAVRNVLRALGTRQPRIALMTAIGVTKHTPGHDWKRRGERLVRASGLAYTIVRPGWFDYNAPDQLRLEMLRGDRRWASDPSDGVVSRAQIADVLVASLTSAAANGKTLELVAEHGPAPTDLEPLFAGLQNDTPGARDAVLDRGNMPLADEPASVLADLEEVKRRAAREPAGWRHGLTAPDGPGC